MAGRLFVSQHTREAKVYVSRLLPEGAMQLLAKATEISEVRVNPRDRPATRRELREGIEWCDCLLCLLTDRIDAEAMDWGPNLRMIANYAVGYNNIDVEAATLRGIPVTNTPGVLTETAADLAWALIMACSRRVVESDTFLREGKFKGWGPLMYLGHDVHGKTLGIIGFGRIGYAVARRARGFDMRILYNGPRRADERLEKSVGAEYVDRKTLLKQADFVSLHPYLSPESTHLIGERELNHMKCTAYLINTSRGPVVDEQALVKALREGRIAGAGLDVFEDEPRTASGLTKCQNAVLLPHIASATVETRTAMGVLAASNIIDLLRGTRPRTVVNPEVLD
ncbi:MAG: D-glycerate dehydrogenase [Armatimonadetes bacterium CG2_30_59_28]|nr:D-glycerate dehydrogenase [Armatimonadota bacterium]OIO89750.1 MAG: D-glycerate dehydrogenase [Armatimonadetes bacterium CG2_30_59_28]PIU66912.1 MAG: D-glycerate dehydrogenase [Armatimonadetes bacterium CG07_land_8_20_14_0_80_59_28]PIX44419.1 MAG: D-glycerate dehydrogenase [Armatimonadetes bacterium CG_4_8_14_3_um_filter_58_9]PIY48318.1 MAG: D-glycerate dehydrogenase [Armatimonadetes bacterium CG_4_10_14_3_um_filter_59_10]